VQLRYHPAEGKTFSVRYRYGRDEVVGTSSQRDVLRQVDIAGQWPIARRWYAVARQNYSLRDRKPLEQLLGVEYNQGCWSTRLVAQRYVTDLTQTKNAVFLQLELKDLSSIGNNPLETLRLAIPGYSKINETADQP
jgi:LPS-assembly protein